MEIFYRLYETGENRLIQDWKDGELYYDKGIKNVEALDQAIEQYTWFVDYFKTFKSHDIHKGFRLTKVIVNDNEDELETTLREDIYE